MLQLFRTNQFFANILLLFYVILLRVFVFVVPTVEGGTGKGVLSLGAEQWLPTSGIGSEIIYTLLILFQAVLLNFIVSQFRIGKETTLFAGMLYVLLVCSMPELAHWSPVLVANTFFIFSLWSLYNSYKKKSAATSIFNVGLTLALASLFYFSYAWYFLMAIFALSILRSFSIKEIWMVLVGFLVPYFLTSVYYFLVDDLSGFWQRHFVDNLSFLDISFRMDAILLAKLGLFVLLIVVVIFSFGQYLMKKSIQVQKNIQVLYLALLFAGLTLFFQASLAMDHLLLLVPSLSILLSLSLLEMKRTNAEIVHFFLLFLAFFFQYGLYLGLFQ